MKIAIVVGHNARAQVFRREYTTAGYRAEIEAVYDQVDAWGADVSAELHFNAVTSAAASGTETWYATDRGEAVAQRVNDALVRVLGLPNRGIKQAGKAMVPGVDGTRGYATLISGRCPAVLVESYFGSNADVCRCADAVRPALGRALYGALCGAVAAPAPAADPPRPWSSA